MHHFWNPKHSGFCHTSGPGNFKEQITDLFFLIVIILLLLLLWVTGTSWYQVAPGRLKVTL